MAWVGLLEAEGVRTDYLGEMNRDIVRLNTVVDRFSKIGQTHPQGHDVAEVVADTVEYMRPRVSKNVEMVFDAPAASVASPRAHPVQLGP